MKLLLINTCGLEGVVALADDAGVRVVERLPGRGTSEHLMPAIRRLFETTGWRVPELGAVAVVIGPGSFTGVRVGLSAAKGLCEAGAVPMVAMSRLELVADALHHTLGNRQIALLDAGRGEYYCGVYQSGTSPVEELLGADAVEPKLRDGDGVTCEERVAQRLGQRVVLVIEPGPDELLAMARRRIGAGIWSDVAAIDANYMRRTDAEILQEKS